MVRRRIWPVIQELYNSAAEQVGNLVDSKTTLQARKGDDKHGIFAIAIKDGPVASAVADIQGVHAERMFIDIDEATDAPEAIMEDFRISVKVAGIFVSESPETLPATLIRMDALLSQRTDGHRSTWIAKNGKLKEFLNGKLNLE